MALKDRQSIEGFVEGVGARGIGAFLENERVEFVLDPVLGLPASLSDKPSYHDQSYLFTPSLMFADYAAQEVDWHMGKAASFAMKVARGPIRSFVRSSGLDRHVQLNAWGVSTQLFDKGHETVEKSVAYWHDRQPQACVMLRSLTKESHPDLWEMEKGVLLPSRQVWLWKAAPSKRRKPDFWRDMKLLDQPGWSWKEGKDWGEEEFAVAEKFYADLYLDKYTYLNPRYTAAGFRLYRDTDVARFWMLYHEGLPVGFVGMIENDDWMTTPFIGYDMTYEDKTLYRRLVAWTFSQAMEKSKALHLSAGASRFKELRGAQPALEASRVFCPPGKSGWMIKGLGKILKLSSKSVMESRY